MGNNTFVFNLEWYAVLMEYPAEVRFEVYEAIMRYASTGTLIELKPLAKMAFSFIRKEMDYNRERYESTIEKRREAGRRSAEARNQQNQHVSTKAGNVQQNQHVSTNPTDNVNDNVNVYNNKKIIVDDFSDDGTNPEKEESSRGLERQFEAFRKSYPGTKRGFKAEFDNFKRKNPKTWREIIPLLAPALERLIEWHERSIAAGQFTPNYKNLATWLNQQCWTEELPEIIENPIIPRNNVANTINNGTPDANQRNIARLVATKLTTPDRPEPDITGNY